jgi:hypothetical protein
MSRKRKRRVVLAVGGEAAPLCNGRVVPVTPGLLRQLGAGHLVDLASTLGLKYWCPECASLLPEREHLRRVNW